MDPNVTVTPPEQDKKKRKKNPFRFLITSAIFGGVMLGAIVYCIVQLAGLNK